MNQVLEVVEMILLEYLKKVHKLNDNESVNICDELEKFMQKVLQTSEDIVHASKEVREELQSQIGKYVLENQDLRMFDLNEEMSCQLCRESTIWYDDEYYYMTDIMLRKVCEGVLEMVSVNELKAILREEGILYCDASGDYSIKIIVKTQNGKQRPRVLKLRKLYLTVDGECLEDIYRERMENNNA